MKILLIAMPDSANNFFRMIKVPNLGLCSIAAGVKDHDVRIVDLVLVHKGIGAYLRKYLAEFRPDVVGISSMSFQYQSARRVMEIVRECNPETKIVLGGYHATMQYESLIGEKGRLFDFIVRGEGETAFRLLIRAMEEGKGFASVPGLSHVDNGVPVHNPPGELSNLDALPLPYRQARVLTDFRYLTRRIDVAETSRGCTYVCNFCSINRMYGRTFRCYTLKRVIDDLEGLRANGTQTVLLVDDNITLNVTRLMALCDEIVKQGLNRMEYLVQASVVGIAKDPQLVEKMAKANVKLVFLGIESVQKKNLEFFRKGDIREKTVRAISLLRSHGIAVMGGFIVGNPDDTKEDVKQVFRDAQSLNIDLAVVQCLTPYPNTRLREELLKMELVTNEHDLSRYNGFICNVKTKHLSTAQLNRLMNWENIKMFFNPQWFANNNFVKNREKGSLRVLLNNFEYIRGLYKGDQFRSRHRF